MPAMAEAWTRTAPPARHGLVRHALALALGALLLLGAGGPLAAQELPSGPRAAELADAGYRFKLVYDGGTATQATPAVQAAPQAPAMQAAPGSPAAQAAPGSPAAQAAPGTEEITPVPAGEPRYADGIYIIKKSYLLSWPENVWRMFTGPLRYEKQDWINVAAVAGGIVALLVIDDEVQDFWQDNITSSTTTDVGDKLEYLGDTPVIVAGSLGAYAVAEMFGAKREKAAALMTFESYLLTALTINGIKFAAGRERPESTGDRFDFGSRHDVNASFPSGHAGHSFAVASVLSEVYGDSNPWVPWLAYSLATGTALARVNSDDHWLSDSFAGAALGYFVGKMVTRYNPFLEEHGMAFKPFSNEVGNGVALAVKF